MKHITNRKFAFAEGEFLDIPTDFSKINGWLVSQTGVTEVATYFYSAYVYLIIAVMYDITCSCVAKVHSLLFLV